jgi:Arc/MetJ family transcription regulator
VDKAIRHPPYGVPVRRYTISVPTKPRIQVTLDAELAAAVAEFGGTDSRSRTVHDLALRGAEAFRAERDARREAHEHLRRIATGEDDGYDFAISEQLHASR